MDLLRLITGHGLIDLFKDVVAIFSSIVSYSYYGYSGGGGWGNDVYLSPEHAIIKQYNSKWPPHR